MKFLSSSVAALSALLLPAVHLQAMPTVSAGGGHSCAILSGNLYCWGANYNGQIGTGNKAIALRPVRIPHPQNHAWIGVSAGYNHTCAVDDTSAAFCWGSNGKGQLGNGTPDDALTPTPVLNPEDLAPLDEVTDLSVSVGSCAVVDGKIACWGPNDAGQLGDNSTSPSPIPVVLSNPAAVARISGGSIHNCSTTTGEQLYCWGDNYFGQLGDGTTNDSSIPLHVFDHILDVTVTENVTCAIGFSRTVGNRLLCWGQNYYGQLGNNSLVDSQTPVVVLDSTGTGALRDISNVSLGGFNTCALNANGYLYCWGANAFGQLGTGDRNDSALPVRVQNIDGSDDLHDVIEIGVGYRHTCARRSDNAILCWGRDEGGGLGDGGTGDRLRPVLIDFDEIFRSTFEQN